MIRNNMIEECFYHKIENAEYSLLINYDRSYRYDTQQFYVTFGFLE